MPEFSSSGILDLPGTTLESLKDGDPRVIGWVREAIAEGDRLNRDDPNYDRIELGQRYVSGDHPLPDDRRRLPYLSKLIINESRKTMQAHVSALTDLKPLFSFKSTDPQFDTHAHLLNKRTIAWWISTMADLAMGDTIKYALAGGTGDTVVEWDPYAPFDGDNFLSARDPRDTLPIRPSANRSLQLWEGLILREEHSVNVLRGMFPTKAHLFTPSADSVIGSIMGRFRTLINRLISPAADTLSGLAPQTHSSRPKSGGVVLYRTYLNDRTKNLTSTPIPMGDPGASWSYIVPPGGHLYPQKRLIVSTPEAIIYDGPGTYWHGLYPVTRLKLWDLPWFFLGSGLLHDLGPLQNAINDTGNDLLLGLKEWFEPQVAYDRTAVSPAFMATHDPRRPNAKIPMNPTGGDGYKRLEGPPPVVLQAGVELLKFWIDRHRDLSGTANLQQLLSLRQIPSGDTLQQYYEALTPELRHEARMVEAYLRDLAEMVKVNWFQFESSTKRITLLGDAGLTLEDFDFDPDNLVPAMSPLTPDPMTGIPAPTPGYRPDLDQSKPRAERARAFHKLFVFMAAPNSLIAMNAQEQKMLDLQLARMGYLDFWTLMETLGRGNVGTPPAIPLPPLRPITPQQMLEEVASLSAGNPPKFIPDPMSGQILEIRVPLTITERLIAQQQLGIGMSINPSGRKASGQSEPKLESKDGGSRQTVTESDK